MANLFTTNIVGSAGENVWSQAQTIVHSEDRQLIVVLQLSSDSNDSILDLGPVGAEMLLDIEKKGLIGLDKSELGSTIQSVVGEAGEGVRVEILVACTEGPILTMYGIGKMEAYLSRDLQLAKLKGDWGEGEILSGNLKEGDVLVLSTQRFVEIVGLPKFKQIMTEDSDPAGALTPLLHKQNDSTGVAAVVAMVGREKEEVIALGDPWWKKMMNKGPKIAVQNQEPRKLNLWVGAVIFLILIIMIGVGMVRRVKQVAENQFNSLNSSINAKIEETISIGDLNPERARSLLTAARGEVESYLGMDVKDEYKDKARKLLVTIETAEDKAFKKNEIKLNTIVELPILAEGLRATKMKSDGKDSLIFLDEGKSRLVSMNINDRSRQIIEGDGSNKFKDTAVSETKVYGLGSEGVFEMSWKKSGVKKVIEPDEFWKNPFYIQLFAGNVYVFDKDQSEIWKYPTLGDTFGSRRRWLAAGITPDLTNVIDMKVVGDIWLLTSTGKLERYSRGAPVNFGMEGFPAKGEAKRFSEPSAVWVSESLIYVLENGAGRVVVFGDDGKYKSQYVSSEFGKASDLVVVDDKAYVLIDNVVKEFGL